MSGNFAIKGGGVRPLMANAILNFHFDFLTTSLNINIKFNNIDNYNTINISCCVVIYEDTEENFSGNVCKPSNLMSLLRKDFTRNNHLCFA